MNILQQMNLVNHNTRLLGILLVYSLLLSAHWPASLSEEDLPVRKCLLQSQWPGHGQSLAIISANSCFGAADSTVLVFPADTAWSCEVFSQFPNVTAAHPLTGVLFTTGSGVPALSVVDTCFSSIVSSDDTIYSCGNTFGIVRTWFVFNWCTGQLITEDSDGTDNVQTILVKDQTSPLLSLVPFSVPAASGSPDCVSLAFLPPALLSSDCSNVVQRIFTPVGEALYVNGSNGNEGGWIPLPGLGLGVHTLTYLAVDGCGNTGQISVEVTVQDAMAPVAICEQGVSVSLNGEGTALIPASAFDNGSYDNCCLDTLLVGRLDPACGDSLAVFDGFLALCCADAGKELAVTLRAVDCHGNYNECMAMIRVKDKQPVQLLNCPADKTINCDFYLEHLDPIFQSGNSAQLSTYFGQAIFTDNCGLVFLDSSVSVSLDGCVQGFITRNWHVTDPAGNATAACQQLITVEHRSDWIVTFPEDKTVNCGETIPSLGEPIVFAESCELLAVSWQDAVFTIVPDACFKIERTWAIINWCDYSGQNPVPESPESVLQTDLNGDGVISGRTFRDGLSTANFQPALPQSGAQPDGYITYMQVVKLLDEIAPEVSCLPVLEVCIFDADCRAEVLLPMPFVVDCSPSLTVKASGDLGTGLGPFLNVEPGTYQMKYEVEDHCNNTSSCVTAITVRDCKKPTPVCVNGLNVTLGEGGELTVHIDSYDAGSFDNCSDSLKLSFSPNVTDTTLFFDCYSIGFVTVRLYATDEAGNQDFCQTFTFVDDDQGACQGPPLIAGKVVTDAEIPISGVTVSLNGATAQELTTDSSGIFQFEVPWGGDYSLGAQQVGHPLNGVTTLDMVLISRHILGISPLQSPWRMIAADVNGSGSVTTSDLIAMRKLILQIDSHFPAEKSWLFVPLGFNFPEPSNPFATAIPQIINYNDLQSDTSAADFIGIKLGDVNGSVQIY
jgi:hypothetical protein